MDAAKCQVLRARLAKKATFEAALRDLQACIAADPAVACDPAVEGLVGRSFTLLRTRYSSRAFWRAGRELYAGAAEAARSCAGSACEGGYLAFVRACDEHLSESEAGAAEAPAPAAPGLFEGQLTSVELPPRRRGLEELLTLAALHGPAVERGDAGVGERAEEASAPVDLAAVDAALEQELEAAIVASLADAEADGARPGGPPPAAKFAVRALRTEALTAERLDALGGAGVECCVCREELAAGMSVQVMPCSAAHAFHPPCLKPWLAAHNSCPICRHELPTDDERYERRKVRDAQEAEDRKGAANAVTHLDFLYT